MTKRRHCGRMSPATSANKGCLQPSSPQPLQPSWLHPEGIQGGDRQDTRPWRVKILIKGMTSKSPSSCIFPHRKVLRSLTWGVWFSLIDRNLPRFWLPGFCCKPPVYPAPPLPLGSGPSELSERLSPGYSLRKYAQRNGMVNFWVVLFFFFQ